MISPPLVSLLSVAAPEEVLGRPPREAWPLARVLNALLMKMGHTACWLCHAVGCRQASLGTPIPRTPTDMGGGESKGNVSTHPKYSSSKDLHYICNIIKGRLYMWTGLQK